MGSATGIAWTHHTANFWMGCQRVSPGCEHCYAEAMVTGRMGLPVWGPPSTTPRQRAKAIWKDVVKWDRAAREAGVRRRCFVSSLADIFEDHPQVAPWRGEALELLATLTSLDVQLLTKRPQHIRAMVPPSWLQSAPDRAGVWRPGWPAHVWVGCTVEDQRRAAERIPHLLAVPAAVRFLSCEPLLDRVDLTRWLVPRATTTARNDPGRCGIQWVICGGESGPKARPYDLAWARALLAQCREAGVPAFHKQMGDHAVRGIEDPDVVSPRLRFAAHHGADPIEWPRDLRVQEFPATPVPAPFALTGGPR